MGCRILLAVGKIIGGTLAVVVLLEIFLWSIFTFKRMEWVYGERWGGELQVFQDKGLGIKAFRFNDYGSADSTYELSLICESDSHLSGAKARVVRKSRHQKVFCEDEFYINKTQHHGIFMMTLTPEFAPVDEDETLKIEIIPLRAHKIIQLEFKSTLVRHFKSI